MKNMKFKDVSTDEQFDLADHSMRQYQSKLDRKPQHKQEDARMKKQISDHNKHEKMLKGCWQCLDSPKFQVQLFLHTVQTLLHFGSLLCRPTLKQKHLVVSMGVAMYLALPSIKVVCPGHCVLATTEHISAMTAFDENVYEEYQVWV